MFNSYIDPGVSLSSLSHPLFYLAYMKRVFFIILLISINATLFSQVFKPTLKTNREKVYRHTINNTITKNLSIPLGDSSEETWRDALQALELLGYHNPRIDSLVADAMDQIDGRTISFQRALLELAYTNYPGQFYQPVKLLLLQAQDPKIFAMCAAYILHSPHAANDANFLSITTKQKLQEFPDNPILQQLLYHVNNFKTKQPYPSIHSFLKKDYLPGKVLMISFQRKNRNYPGLVMVRARDGNFVKDTSGNFFSVPQLARSISNLPPYLTNGSTPEGIFRMKGFDQSKLSFIGPTKNIQMTMPFEKDPAHFFNNPAITDTSWHMEQYKKLLPAEFKNYYPILQSFYAGKAGRSEIIAHGSTVNPMYYLNEPYFPLTPTQGCLSTKELWNEMNGTRTESDQHKLVNAVMSGGGADGYAIVINIDDEQKPVTLNDVLPFLKRAGHK